jgi:murein DD-endopeptidase MepM/ murein hydrolase activator NlpD
MSQKPKKTKYYKPFLPILLLAFPLTTFAFSLSIFTDLFKNQSDSGKSTFFKQENLQTLRVFEPNKVFASTEEIDIKKVSIIDENSTSFEKGNSFIDDLESGDMDNHHENAIYSVQKGDSINSIASYFGVSVDTIMTFNHMTSKTVSVGDVLEVPSVSGVMYEIKKGDTLASLSKKYGVDSEDIALYNGLLSNDTLQAGDDIFLPGAKEDVKVKKNTTIFSKTFAKDATTKKGVTWARGDTSHLNTSSSIKKYSSLPKLEGYFVFPAPGSTRTQKMHGNNGADFANKTGSPVIAAADGVVAVAKTSGYNYGYGNYIKITHPNGTETIYGHLSKVNVSAGQSVTRGQQIGAVGSTGNSTGPHLHFEIHGAYNPFAW